MIHAPHKTTLQVSPRNVRGSLASRLDMQTKRFTQFFSSFPSSSFPSCTITVVAGRTVQQHKRPEFACRVPRHCLRESPQALRPVDHHHGLIVQDRCTRVWTKSVQPSDPESRVPVELFFQEGGRARFSGARRRPAPAALARGSTAFHSARARLEK